MAKSPKQRRLLTPNRQRTSAEADKGSLLTGPAAPALLLESFAAMASGSLEGKARMTSYSRERQMISAGFETTDPISKTRFVVVKGAQETAGRGWVLEHHCPVGAAPYVTPHVHPNWTETFEILDGTASYRLGTAVQVIRAGESITMPPGVPHIHPWNTGSGIVVYRQTTDFGAVSPEAVHEVLGAFATINGLAREGRIGRKGMPKNPFQAAATIRTVTKHGAFDAAVPIMVQRLVSATMGRLAEALGYRAVYDRYLAESEPS